MENTLFIRISGRVQGVGFRWCSYEQFDELGLKGKAENGRDGSVEVTVTGEEPALQKFVEWCHAGPKGARVNRVDVTEVKPVAAEAGGQAVRQDHEKSDN